LSCLCSLHANTSSSTTFDPQPKIANRHVDLLRLYNLVINSGGYDVVSAKTLEWRRLGLELNLIAPSDKNNLGALAHNLKTAYYKYLA
jgi:chromatin structure-remodeling complex subunit RSC9